MLRWDWNKPIGRIHWKNCLGEYYDTKVYRGNAMIICISEWVDGEGKVDWQMGLFIIDKEHFKKLCRDKSWNFAEDIVWAEFWDLNSETWSFVKELHRREVPLRIHK